MQRTLGEPLGPVAPLDAFTSSLAAHQNPSFLAPLGHRIDSGSGGLVDGLADLAPGSPIARTPTPDLPVRTAHQPADRPAVQRRWGSFLSAPDVDVAPLESPTAPITEPTTAPYVEPPAGEAPSHPVAPIASSPVVGSVPLTPTSAPTPAAGSADAPVRSLDGPEPPVAVGSETLPLAVPSSTSRPTAPVQRSVAQPVVGVPGGPSAVLVEPPKPTRSAPKMPVLELPVLRSVDVSSVPSRPTAADTAADAALSEAGPSAPAVQLSAEQPAEPDAPLSGFAAAVLGSRFEPEPAAAATSPGPDVVPPATQRLPELPVVPSPTTELSETRVPVGRAGQSTGSQSRSDREPMAPTTAPSVQLLGSRTPLVQRHELSSAPTPAPVAQPITYLSATEPVGTSRVVQRSASSADSISPRPGVEPGAVVQPAPAVALRAVVQRVLAASSPGSRQPSPAALPTSSTVHPEPPGLRPVPQDPVHVDPAPSDSAPFDSAPSDPVQLDGPGAAPEPLGSGSTLDLTLQRASGPAGSVPADFNRHPVAPYPTPATSARPSSAPETPVDLPRPTESPLPADQPWPDAAAGQPTAPESAYEVVQLSPADAEPLTAVGPPIRSVTVQRSSTDPAARLALPTWSSGSGSTPTRTTTTMPPTRILQRQPAATTTAVGSAARPVHRGAAPTQAGSVSFASMFGGASDHGSNPAEDGFTSVQLAPDSTSAPPEPAPAPEAGPASEAAPAATPAPAPAAPAPAANATDLDEMARRLFEPLSARLRAEFSLDRERAGMVTDARP